MGVYMGLVYSPDTEDDSWPGLATPDWIFNFADVRPKPVEI